MEMNKVIEDQKVKYVSTKNFGICIEDGTEKGLWINFDSKASQIKIEEMQELLKNINKGDTIKLEMTNQDKFVSFEVTKQAEQTQEQKKGGLGIAELLNIAHEKYNLFGVETEALNIDQDKGYALFKATVWGTKPNKDGTVRIGETEIKPFTGHGHMTRTELKGRGGDENAYIEIAETRAVKRALMRLTNSGNAEDDEKVSEDKQKEETKKEETKEEPKG